MKVNEIREMSTEEINKKLVEVNKNYLIYVFNKLMVIWKSLLELEI